MLTWNGTEYENEIDYIFRSYAKSSSCMQMDVDECEMKMNNEKKKEKTEVQFWHEIILTIVLCVSLLYLIHQQSYYLVLCLPLVFLFVFLWIWNKEEIIAVSVTHTALTHIVPCKLNARCSPHRIYPCSVTYRRISLLEFNGTRSNLTVAGGSLVTLSCEIAPGVFTTGDVPTYDEPSIFDICIPTCGSQWFLNTFNASSSLSSIRVPCKLNNHNSFNWNECSLRFRFSTSTTHGRWIFDFFLNHISFLLILFGRQWD